MGVKTYVKDSNGEVVELIRNYEDVEDYYELPSLIKSSAEKLKEDKNYLDLWKNAIVNIVRGSVVYGFKLESGNPVCLHTRGEVKDMASNIADSVLNLLMYNKKADIYEIAREWFLLNNPDKKYYCTPTEVFQEVRNYYVEWLNVDTDLDLFQWILKNKQNG